MTPAFANFVSEDASEVVAFEIFGFFEACEESFVVGFGIGAGILATRGGFKEAFELFEVILSPLIEGVFMTLSALNSRTEESVGEGDDAIFGRLEVLAGPEMRESVSVGVSGGTGAILMVESRDIAAVVFVGFVGIAADCHNDSLHEFIIGGVIPDAFFNPCIPLF